MLTTLRCDVRSMLIALHFAVTVQRIFCVVPRATVSDQTRSPFGEFSFATAMKSALSACHKTRASIKLTDRVYHISDTFVQRFAKLSENCAILQKTAKFFKKMRFIVRARAYMAIKHISKNKYYQKYGRMKKSVAIAI